MPRVRSRREPFVCRILIEVKLIEAERLGVTVHEAEIAALVVARYRPGIRVVIDIRTGCDHLPRVGPQRREIVFREQLSCQ
jgi:hypothetical protein